MQANSHHSYAPVSRLLSKFSGRLACKDSHISSSTYQQADLCLGLQRDQENNSARQTSQGNVTSDDIKGETSEPQTVFVDKSNLIPRSDSCCRLPQSCLIPLFVQGGNQQIFFLFFPILVFPKEMKAKSPSSYSNLPESKNTDSNVLHKREQTKSVLIWLLRGTPKERVV